MDAPQISLSETKHVGELKYRFVEYVRSSDEERSAVLLGSPMSVNGDEIVAPHDEMQYLNLVRHIIENGHEKGDRYDRKVQVVALSLNIKLT